MPTALVQGTWSASTLRSHAMRWARQLKAAGVNLNLAPVMDTVTSSFAPLNPPIGVYDREYGHTPARVAAKGAAFLDGMRAVNVATTIKHFPDSGASAATPTPPRTSPTRRQLGRPRTSIRSVPGSPITPDS